jgi:hypothetical protein
MKRVLSQVAVGLSFSFLLLSAAIARPVTSADLSGKKICWNDGNIDTYFPGGKISSRKGGDGNWRVTTIGLQVSGAYGSFVHDMQILPDGTFTDDIDCGCSRVYHWIGHYCE